MADSKKQKLSPEIQKLVDEELTPVQKSNYKRSMKLVEDARRFEYSVEQKRDAIAIILFKLERSIEEIRNEVRDIFTENQTTSLEYCDTKFVVSRASAMINENKKFAEKLTEHEEKLKGLQSKVTALGNFDTGDLFKDRAVG